jgi:leader peptidase (prepilin peptidase)/N-methyltransferase
LVEHNSGAAAWPSWRETAVGLAAAVLSAFLLPAPAAVFAPALALIAVFIAIVDIRRFVIPDWTDLLLLILGLCLVVVEAQPGAWLRALGDGGARAALAGGSLWLLRQAYWKFSGVEGLGLGDVKLAAAGAPWLMWATLPLALVIAAIAALLVIGTRAALWREDIHRKTQLPFGAFLAPAIWLSFLLERLDLLAV